MCFDFNPFLSCQYFVALYHALFLVLFPEAVGAYHAIFLVLFLEADHVQHML